MPKKILLLEDDTILAETLEDLLSRRGYRVDRVGDGARALEATFANAYDLLLLDVNVPGVDGFTFLQQMRESGDSTPALFLSARTDIASLAKGFEIGADDYIKKPFDFDELLIRIEAILRKAYQSRNDEIALGDFLYSITKDELYRDGQFIHLPPSDLRIVRTLFKHRDSTVHKEALLEVLGDGEHGSEGALRVHISRLRKLGLPIETIKGIGYRLAES